MYDLLFLLVTNNRLDIITKNCCMRELCWLRCRLDGSIKNTPAKKKKKSQRLWVRVLALTCFHYVVKITARKTVMSRILRITFAFDCNIIQMYSILKEKSASKIRANMVPNFLVLSFQNFLLIFLFTSNFKITEHTHTAEQPLFFI